MPRLPERCPFYYFRSKTTGHRKGWVYPSRKAAKKAFYEENWRYLDYPRLDDFLRTLHPYKKNWGVFWWKDAKARVEDLEMARGYLRYIETKDTKRADDKDLEGWKKRNKHLLEKDDKTEQPPLGDVQ